MCGYKDLLAGKTVYIDNMSDVDVGLVVSIDDIQYSAIYIRTKWRRAEKITEAKQNFTINITVNSYCILTYLVLG
jgi:hypothetical protein